MLIKTARFIVTSALIFASPFFLALPLVIASPVAAQTPLSIGALSVAGDPIDQIIQLFKTRLEREAPDRFDIKLLVRGETGGEEALMSAVRRGRMSMASFTGSGMSAVVPEFSLIMAPYLFSSTDELDFVLDHYLAEPLWALAEERNLHVFGWLDDGWVSIYAKDPLLLPEDVEGYAMRAWQVPTSRLFFETLGADTIGMPFPDVIPALQTGLIGGSEIAPMFYDVVGMAEHAPHFVLTRHTYNTGVLAADKNWFDSLPETDRASIVAAVPDKHTARALLRDGVAAYYESMKMQGATVHTLTDRQRKRWVDSSLPAHEALLQELGPRARELYDIIQDGKRAYAASKTHDAGAEEKP